MWKVEQAFFSKKNKKLHRKDIVICSVIGVIALAAMAAVILYYRYTTIYIPNNTYIENIPVGGLRYDETEQYVKEKLPSLPDSSLTLSADGIEVASSSAELHKHQDIQAVVDDIKARTTTGKLRWQVWWRITPLFKPQYETAALIYDQESLNEMISELNKKVEYPGEEPAATLERSGNVNTLEIFKGTYGKEIDVDTTRSNILSSISTESQNIAAKIASPGGELSEEQIEAAKERSSKLIDKSINFYYENKSFTLNDVALIDILALPDGYNQKEISDLVEEWKISLDREPQEPELEYNSETLIVSKFVPPKDGLKLNQEATIKQIEEKLSALEQADSEDAEESAENNKKAESIELVVQTAKPQKSLADTNDLGITESIGFGDSYYDHSIPNRIHNVAITSERISDVIVPPGTEFSFNKTLGDVSAATGYRSAYVIKNGQTALGDGGGVCQVSTTVFRAVLDAGLKVTRRLPHSYRVSYYELDEKPGVDATVYSGNVDLRFVNDTDEHILIHSEADSKNLYMYVEIYGTSDGRTTEIVDHKTWNYRPAPAAQYIPDPSLPAGTLKQVDWAAPGISASFINVIKDKEGKILREDTYTSNYRPWSAKYLQGTAGQ